MAYKSYKNTINQKKTAKDIIRAYEWNNLFKILAEQGNHLNEGLLEIYDLYQDQENRIGLRDIQIADLKERADLLESQTTIYVQKEEPTEAKDGDVWYRIIEED